MMMLPPIVVSLPFKLMFSCSSTAGQWLREARAELRGLKQPCRPISPASAHLGSAAPNLNTRLPREDHDETAIPAQTWRSLAV